MPPPPPAAAVVSVHGGHPPHFAPQAADAAAFFQGQPSSEIANALVKHYSKMHRVALEYASNADPAAHSLHGQTSDGIADALVRYAKAHPHEGVPRQLKLATKGTHQPAHDAIWQGFGFRPPSRAVANENGTYTISGELFTAPPFSIASTVQELYWAQVVLCIVWILTGTLLLFAGAPSFAWLSRLGKSSRSRRDRSTRSKGRASSSSSSGPWLLGGLGGALSSFLFISFLSLLVLSAICSRGHAAPGPKATFVIWLIPALILGAPLGGRFLSLGRASAALLGGASLTLILGAIFGVHSLVARIVLLSISASVLCALVLLPSPHTTGSRASRHALSLSTALVGSTTLLCGISLFAPPAGASRGWLDLWALLLAPDGSSTAAAAVTAWGSPAFKGYTAGAVLCILAGCAAQWLLSQRLGIDASDEWNEYLGGYAEAAASASASGSGAVLHGRKGIFEPAPTTWQRLAGLFGGRARGPAAYSGLAERDHNGSRFTQFSPPSSARRKLSSSRRSSRRTSGPARFSALLAKDADDFELRSDDDACDSSSDTVVDEKRDALLAKNADPVGELKEKAFFRGFALPRPPSYCTDSNSSSSGASSDGTKVQQGKGQVQEPEVQKPFDAYSDGCKSSASTPKAQSPTKSNVPMTVTAGTAPAAAAAPTRAEQTPMAAAATPMVPATPSLINAITRIQQAQEQARAWQQASSAVAQSAESGAGEQKGEQAVRASADAQTRAVLSASAGQGTSRFDAWWDKVVREKK